MRCTAQHRQVRIAWALALLIVATPTPAQPVLEKGLDTSIRPGDDFFAFANGEWLKATTLPAGKNRWTARNEIDATTRQQMTQLFADLSNAPRGSRARKIADFRDAYLNQAAIEKRGLAPIASLLSRIDGVKDKVELARLLGSELRADVDPLDWGVYASSHVFGISVNHGIHGEKNRFAYLVQGGLGLPDRDHYLSEAPAMQAKRLAYQTYIGRILALAGFDQAAGRAEKILALETSIAKTHSSDELSGNERNADNHWSQTDFAANAPGLDWKAFFAAARLTNLDRIVAWQPNAIKGEAALIASESLQVWQDYLRFHALHRYIDLLPQKFDEAANGLRESADAGTSREQNATDATNKAIPEIIGRVYVDKYFAAKSKTRAQLIATNVVGAFGKRIDSVRWMMPAAKSEAIAKLNALYFGVGFPEVWTDDSALTVDATDPIGNLQRVSNWRYDLALARLRQPADIRDWILPPHRVAAVLLLTQNAYNFPAALMQAPKFDPTASDAENYGAIGAIIGHEVSHFIDTLGSDYDASGALRRWWTAADLQQYEAAAASLAKQVSSYRPLPDQAIDGQRSTVENVADLAGLSAAFDAHRHALGNKIGDKQFVRQQDRFFFIGFARSWRSKQNDDALRDQLKTDNHAPDRYRIATVRNLDAWYEAFDVVPGQAFYLEPKDRVRIW